jgi:uncharacterized membrane protein YidH (DUF202 family)
MRVFRKIIFLFLVIASIWPQAQIDVRAENIVNIYYFYDETCTNCHFLGLYLDEIEAQYGDSVVIHRFEITQNAESAELYLQVKELFEIEDDPLISTPFTVIGGVYLAGYNSQIERDIQTMISRYLYKTHVDVVEKMLNGEVILPTDFDTLEPGLMNLPIIGEVHVDELSLFLAAVVLGTVDGFNPCAMWVLIFLITMFLNSKDRKRMWILGIIFLFTSAFMYYLIMAAWLNVAISLTAVNWIRILIGFVAFGFGSYNLYKFIKSLKQKDIGCEVTDVTQKKKIIDKIKKIVLERNFFLATIGIILLAISVNFVELACSAGLPFLFSQILAYNDLSAGTNYLYIGLYVFFFLLDDLIVFAVAMLTLKVTGISNKYGKVSQVLGGIIMIAIAIMLIWFPEIIRFNF